MNIFVVMCCPAIWLLHINSTSFLAYTYQLSTISRAEREILRWFFSNLPHNDWCNSQAGSVAQSVRHWRHSYRRGSLLNKLSRESSRSTGLGGATRDGNLAFQCGFQEGVAAVATHALPEKSETQKWYNVRYLIALCSLVKFLQWNRMTKMNISNM